MTFAFRGCRVSADFSFFVVIAVLLLFDRSGEARNRHAAAALHECAHLASMRALGCLPERIRFTAFGVDIVRPCRPDHGYLRDAAVSLSGPAANLTAAALISLFSGSAAHNSALANFALFAFNILPVGPLDGGQALYSLLCLRWEPDAAARAVGIVSFVFLAPVATTGFLTLFRSPGNFTLLLVCVYLMALLIFKRDGRGGDG